VRVGDGFAGKVAATGEPVVLDHVDATTVTSQILIDNPPARVRRLGARHRPYLLCASYRSSLALT